MKLIRFAGALLLAAGTVFAQTDGPVLRVAEAEDQIVRIRAKTRHTTVIVLPATETVLDFVVGDSEYWHLTGAANLAFLKPVAEGVTTNVALVCASGRIYSFLVTERGRATRIWLCGSKPRRKTIQESPLQGMNPPSWLAGRSRPISRWPTPP